MIFWRRNFGYFFPAAVAIMHSLAALPPPQKLSSEDLKGMTEEVNRLKSLLGPGADQCWVEFEIARTYGAGGQYRETIEWLQKVVDLNCGFDPSREQLFAPFSGRKEFEALNTKARDSMPPVSNSQAVTTIPETELFPENMAYDPSAKTFFIGSTSKDEIVRCRSQRPCEPFVSSRREGLGYVLGLKLDKPSKALWATSNTDDGASVRHYSLASGRLLGTYALAGAHVFNDLAVSSRGEVFITDTKEGAVYKLPGENGTLERLAPKHVFTAANGIALSSDERKLFVANFADGITAVDLASESTTPIRHPAEICLAYIDGLYAQKGSLIAIQNGPMASRIARFLLERDTNEIRGMKVLERGNPLFDGLTTGTLESGQFYYIANTQMDKKDAGKTTARVHLNPLHILAINLVSH